MTSCLITLRPLRASAVISSLFLLLREEVNDMVQVALFIMIALVAALIIEASYSFMLTRTMKLTENKSISEVSFEMTKWFKFAVKFHEPKQSVG